MLTLEPPTLICLKVSQKDSETVKHKVLQYFSLGTLKKTENDDQLSRKYTDLKEKEQQLL